MSSANAWSPNDTWHVTPRSHHVVRTLVTQNQLERGRAHAFRIHGNDDLFVDDGVRKTTWKCVFGSITKCEDQVSGVTTLPDSQAFLACRYGKGSDSSRLIGSEWYPFPNFALLGAYPNE